jgi:hypothetical protein
LYYRYSLDYGNKWEKFIFSEETPVEVKTITTNPSSTSLTFVLEGASSPNDEKQVPQQVIIALDFSKVLDRKCE